MHPILVEFYGLSIKTYGLFVAIGFLTGITLALKEARRIHYDQQLILDLSFYIIVAAIVGSRLFYVVTNLHFYYANPLDIFKVWQGGLTFFGGFVLAFIVGIWFMKQHQLPVLRTFDLFAPSLAIGECLGRIGCFFAGCCYGKECALPWSVTFTNPQSLARLYHPLHPTQLYTSAAALVTFLLLFGWRKRKAFDGQLTIMWIFLYSAFRFFIEFYRGDPRGYLLLGEYSITQVMALLFVLGAPILYVVIKKKSTALPR